MSRCVGRISCSKIKTFDLRACKRQGTPQQIQLQGVHPQGLVYAGHLFELTTNRVQCHACMDNAEVRRKKTIVNSDRAADATVAIIETFDKVQTLKQELLELHKETDKEVQKTKMQHFGEVLSDIVMPDLQTQETESSLEINFFIGKIKHTVKRVRKEEPKDQK